MYYKIVSFFADKLDVSPKNLEISLYDFFVSCALVLLGRRDNYQLQSGRRLYRCF